LIFSLPGPGFVLVAGALFDRIVFGADRFFASAAVLLRIIDFLA
jgi:hypothetical protein